MGLWLKRLAILSVLGFPLSLMGSRLGLFDFQVGFAIIRYTLLLAVAIFFVGMTVNIVQRKSDAQGSRAAKMGTCLALIPLVGLGSLVYVARTVPYIHNISTDVVNPPDFDKIAGLRGKNANPLHYETDKLADLQQAAYPNVKTLFTSDSLVQAHANVIKIVNLLGWEIVNQSAAKGIIEATDTTALWAFKDDVVIRITSVDDKTAIDLRSVSRVGQSDLGTNAKRIEQFLQAYPK